MKMWIKSSKNVEKLQNHATFDIVSQKIHFLKIRKNNLIFACSLFLLVSSSVFGQLYTNNIYNKDRNKSNFSDDDKSRYDDFEKYLQYQSADELSDSSGLLIEERLMASPEELRKLGVSEDFIEELQYLSELKDSLDLIQSEIKRNSLGEEVKDSLDINDLSRLIQIKRKEVIEKALEIPAPAIWGHDFFRRSILEIYENKFQYFKASNNYVLGPGDEMSIVIWGQKDFNESYKIDNNGTIHPPIVGKIHLQGISFENAKELIRDKFKNTYGTDDFKLELTLNYSRNIRVNLVGELFNPGTYEFNAINSVFNALVAIQGPNQLGSVRKIYIRRNGTTVKELDVYKYLLDPTSEQDFFLEDNDYVFVPAIEKVVHIEGEVNRPHNYELKEGESLQDIVKFAGHLKAGAFTKNISVKRYLSNREILIDISLDSLIENNKRFLLTHGDSIFINKIPQNLRNFVVLDGAVRVPGRYELRQGDRVSDVLYRAEGVREDAEMSKAYVIRLEDNKDKKIFSFNLQNALLNTVSSDNLKLQSLDTIQVISKDISRQKFLIYLSGEVNLPGEYEYAEGITIGDLLNLAGGLKNESANSRIEISRMTFMDDEPSLSSQRIFMKRIDIDKNLEINMSDEEYELKPYDQVFVRLSPEFESQQQVIILGEIQYPGEYTLTNKQEKIVSLIKRSGGFTDHAFLKGAKLYRNADSLGFVILDLDDAISNPDKSEFNYILTDQDSIVIPKLKDFVTMKGAIRYFEMDSTFLLNVPFIGKKSANKYIQEYGAGFGKYGKKFRTYVQYPNGRVAKTKKLLFINTYPKVEEGSTIFVDVTGRKKNEAKREERKDNKNWNDAFDSLTSKIATILTVLVLVQQAGN